MTYDTFFQAAMAPGREPPLSPYDYQCRLACGPDAKASQPQTLAAGRRCKSQLINIPTGLGKTADCILTL